jgi:hypothetical protein
MDPLYIFYSWQSDWPDGTNRSLIETALKNAITALNKEETLGVELAVDRDTQDEQGAPHIAETILKKIERATIFVCDVSFINPYVSQDTSLSAPNGKKPRLTPNPNVMLELGYALRVLGPDRILMVFNEASGKVEELPFDIRYRRIIRYTSSPEETGEGVRAGPRKEMEKLFRLNIPAMLHAAEQTLRADRQALMSRADTFRQSRVEKVVAGEPPLNADWSKPLVLLHIIPLMHLDNETVIDVSDQELGERTQRLHPLMTLSKRSEIRGNGFRNSVAPDEHEKHSADGPYRRSHTHIFRNGVVEFADLYWLSDVPFNHGGVRRKGFRFPVFDAACINALRAVIAFYRERAIAAPIAVFLTVCHAKGLVILHHKWGTFQGQPWDDTNHLVLQGQTIEDLAAADAADVALKPIFDQLSQELGLPRALTYGPDGRLDPEVQQALERS